MTLRYFRCLALLLGSTLAFVQTGFGAPAPQAVYKFTKANNKVDWEAVGNPGFLRIAGSGGAAEGTLQVASGKVSGELAVALKPYATGIETRDKHMHEKYLETTKFPTAKLVLKDAAFKENVEFTWQGRLTIKDTTSEVTGTAIVQGKKVNAAFKLPIKDYPSIGVPKYLGITLADEVDVSMEASL